MEPTDLDWLGSDPTSPSVDAHRRILSCIDTSNSFPPPSSPGAAQCVLDELEVPHRWPAGSPERGVYCSRTLNLRSIKAIGYDMDYTLIHYDVNAWEVRQGQQPGSQRGEQQQHGVCNVK